MTAFEIFMKSKGFEFRQGSLKEFNTYNNVSRSWVDKEGSSYLIGLYAQPTRIGVLSPSIFIDGQLFTSLPTESQFQNIYNIIKIAK